MSSKHVSDKDIDRLADALDKELAEILAQAAEATSNMNPGETTKNNLEDGRTGGKAFLEPALNIATPVDDWDKALPATEVWPDVNGERLELESGEHNEHSPPSYTNDQDIFDYLRTKDNGSSNRFSDSFWQELEEATKISSSLAQIDLRDTEPHRVANRVADLSADALSSLIEQAVEKAVCSALHKYAKTKV